MSVVGELRGPRVRISDHARWRNWIGQRELWVRSRYVHFLVGIGRRDAAALQFESGDRDERRGGESIFRVHAAGLFVHVFARVGGHGVLAVYLERSEWSTARRVAAIRAGGHSGESVVVLEWSEFSERGEHRVCRLGCNRWQQVFGERVL